MSDEAPQENHNTPSEEEKLSELLDSALGDFGKNMDVGEGEGKSEESADAFLSPSDIQKMAGDFHQMVRHLAEVQRMVSQPEGSGEGVALAEPSAAGPAVSLPEDFPANPEMMNEMIYKNLNLLAERAQKVSTAANEDEYMAAMGAFQSAEGIEDEFMAFMGGMMGALLSKDMLYPSIKEISDKYPAWLEENKNNLSSEDLNRYQQQSAIMAELCTRFEQENPNDTEEAKAENFQKIVGALQQMQLLGQPPKDLVGELPDGWSLDPSTGIPTMVDEKTGSDNCSLM